MFSQFLTEEIQRFIDQQNINKDHFKLKKKKVFNSHPLRCSIESSEQKYMTILLFVQKDFSKIV